MQAIAELTFRKIKEPAFLIMVLLAFLLGATFSEIEPLSEQAGSSNSILSQFVTAQKGHPLFTSTLFAFAMSSIVAIFAGATDIPRDIESGMIMLLISKPVKKSEYMLGKFMGIMALCALFFIGTEVTIIISHWLKTKQFYNFGEISRQFFMLIPLLPMVALTIMFSCFFQDLGAMIITVAYVVLAIALSAVPVLLAMLPATLTSGIQTYLYIFYYLFPNFVYYFQTFKLFGLVSFSLIIYSVAMTAIFLSIATYRLKNRDLI
jgi:ABC-type transport system involved in multi-copper enzyme maturation permease subunit